MIPVVLAVAVSSSWKSDSDPITDFVPTDSKASSAIGLSKTIPDSGDSAAVGEVRGMVPHGGGDISIRREGVDPAELPKKLDSTRQYWWMPAEREWKQKKKAWVEDSILRSGPPMNRVKIAPDLFGFRFGGGWYRGQLGLSVDDGPRLWRFVVGGGILYRVSRSELDSVERRLHSFGYDVRLHEERLVKGPGPLSFQFGLGPLFRWRIDEETTDSSETTSWRYRSDREPRRGSRRNYTLGGLFSIGARIHTETGTALAGGMEVGPGYTFTRHRGAANSQAGSSSEWTLIEPRWTLGVDWLF